MLFTVRENLTFVENYHVKTMCPQKNISRPGVLGSDVLG